MDNKKGVSFIHDPKDKVNNHINKIVGPGSYKADFDPYKNLKYTMRSKVKEM